jgi:hypothetical protein
MNRDLLIVNFEKLEKSCFLLRDILAHLPPLEPNTIDNARAMEPYDALASRFERVVEIAVNRFFRSVELVVQGKPSETLRDRLQLMCKAGLISSPELWLEMRDFRNRIAHDYLPEQLVAIYDGIRTRFLVEINHCVTSAKSFTEKHREG